MLVFQNTSRRCASRTTSLLRDPWVCHPAFYKCYSGLILLGNYCLADLKEVEAEVYQKLSQKPKIFPPIKGGSQNKANDNLKKPLSKHFRQYEGWAGLGLSQLP